MERPRPTKQLILDMTGENQYLISCLHHGLNETPLWDIYPHINFDEAVVFAAETWNQRDKDYNGFRRTLDYHGSDLYGLFNEINKSGFPWLNKHKDISDRLKSKHEKMNPFQNNLRERLERAEPKKVVELLERLERETKEYVFDCQYRDRKRARGDNFGLECMTFQNAYPKKGKIVPAFATEISRQFSRYPRKFVPFEKDDISAGYECHEEGEEEDKEDGEGTPMSFGFAEE